MANNKLGPFVVAQKSALQSLGDNFSYDDLTNYKGIGWRTIELLASNGYIVETTDPDTRYYMKKYKITEAGKIWAKR